MRRTFAALSALAGVAIVIMACGAVAAYPFDLTGYVKNEEGAPVRNATIILQAAPKDPSTGLIQERNITYQFATDSTGFYHVSFGVNEPDYLANSGDSVKVTADYGDYSGTGSLVIPQNSLDSERWVNITIQKKAGNPILNPVGILTIIVIVSAIVSLLIWMYVRRKREGGSDGIKDGHGGSSRRRRRR